MLVCLLELRAQGFGHVGQPEVRSLAEPPSVTLELALLETQVGSQRLTALRILHRGHRGGECPAEEGDLLGEDPRVVQLLGQVQLQLIDDATTRRRGSEVNVPFVKKYSWKGVTLAWDRSPVSPPNVFSRSFGRC